MTTALPQAIELREPFPDDRAIPKNGRIVANCKLGLDICPAGAISGKNIHCLASAQKTDVKDNDCLKKRNECDNIIYEAKK